MGYDYLYPYYLLKEKLEERKRFRRQKKQLRSHLRESFKKKVSRNPKTVYLLMTPEHENIGDHAIAQAETEFLEQQGIDYVEVTGAQLEDVERLGLFSVFNGKPILMQGGGYLGTFWFWSEETVRRILEHNPDSPVVFLPNTIYYEPGEWGQSEFKKSIAIYGRHKNLHIYAREKTSYETMRQVYPNVKLIPDMVFSMNRYIESNRRSGCVICLRNDCERSRTEEQESVIRSQVAALFGENVRNSDMIAKGSIPVDQRENALQKKFAEFAGAQLVVTDRLHGMVFCAIVGTPCIVVNSKSPKVLGCYEWIRHLPYIRILDDVSRLAEVYRSIPEGPHCYDNSKLTSYYQELAEDVHEIFFRR